MQKILPIFQKTKGHVEILTKSELVLRDIDLIKKIPDVTVGISCNTLDDVFSKKTEPGASLASARLSALKQLYENNISTYLFISPIFPEITDVFLLMKECSSITDYFLFENLNLRASYKKRVLNFIAENYPEHIDIYNKIYNTSFGKQYWILYKKKIENFGKILNKDVRIYFNHGE